LYAFDLPETERPGHAASRRRCASVGLRRCCAANKVGLQFKEHIDLPAVATKIV
jgi:hypothetical protein